MPSFLRPPPSPPFPGPLSPLPPSLALSLPLIPPSVFLQLHIWSIYPLIGTPALIKGFNNRWGGKRLGTLQITNPAHTVSLKIPSIHVSYQILYNVHVYHPYSPGNIHVCLTYSPVQESCCARICTVSVLHTANKGPMKIQYKCLVPIYVFPEMKL
jgi:hypothetical protein